MNGKPDTGGEDLRWLSSKVQVLEQIIRQMAGSSLSDAKSRLMGEKLELERLKAEEWDDKQRKLQAEREQLEGLAAEMERKRRDLDEARQGLENEKQEFEENYLSRERSLESDFRGRKAGMEASVNKLQAERRRLDALAAELEERERREKEELERRYISKEKSLVGDFRQRKAALEASIRAREKEISEKGSLLAEQKAKINQKEAVWQKKFQVERDRLESLAVELEQDQAAPPERDWPSSKVEGPAGTAPRISVSDASGVGVSDSDLAPQVPAPSQRPGTIEAPEARNESPAPAPPERDVLRTPSPAQRAGTPEAPALGTEPKDPEAPEARREARRASKVEGLGLDEAWQTLEDKKQELERDYLSRERIIDSDLRQRKAGMEASIRAKEDEISRKESALRQNEQNALHLTAQLTTMLEQERAKLREVESHPHISRRKIYVRAIGLGVLLLGLSLYLIFLRTETPKTPARMASAPQKARQAGPKSQPSGVVSPRRPAGARSRAEGASPKKRVEPAPPKSSDKAAGTTLPEGKERLKLLDDFPEEKASPPKPSREEPEAGDEEYLTVPDRLPGFRGGDRI